jgi:hypothetical protein
MCFIFLKSKDDNKFNDDEQYGREIYNESRFVNKKPGIEKYYEEFAGEIISPIMLEEMEMDSEMIDNLDNK